MVCRGTLLSLLSPHLFHSFDVINPIVNGQGQARITKMDYYTSYTSQGRKREGYVDFHVNILKCRSLAHAKYMKSVDSE